MTKRTGERRQKLEKRVKAKRKESLEGLKLVFSGGDGKTG